ncbi:MAG TPA: hypothetical protein DGN59_02640 [Candidatus Latescibacteria bacterium]|nr:hypothetical protein [Candidatus Latescibacterota bacterium]
MATKPYIPRMMIPLLRIERLQAMLVKALLLVSFVTVGCGDSEGASNTDLASQAPQIPVPDAKQFALGDHAGKVVLVNFWATWCVPCRLEIPALAQLRRDFSTEDVTIVGISTGEYGAPDQVRRRLATYIGQSDINYPIYYDETTEVTLHYNEMAPFINTGIPATLILDQQGRVHKRQLGVPFRDGRLDPHGILSEDIQRLLDG